MSKIHLSALLIASSAFTATVSMASLNEAMIQRQMDRQETTAMNPVRVEGPLSCNLGESNTGESCDLSIRDQKSGRTFALSNNTSAMRLYMQGARVVLIEGKLETPNTIAVSKVSSL